MFKLIITYYHIYGKSSVSGRGQASSRDSVFQAECNVFTLWSKSCFLIATKLCIPAAGIPVLIINLY